MADFDGSVVIGAGVIGGCGGVQHHPVDAEVEEAGVAEGIGFGGEVGLRGCTLLPLIGECGRDGSLAAVFGEVWQGTAQGCGAEGLGVFAVFVDIFCVEGEEGDWRGIGARPQECLRPGVTRVKPGKF